jgi:hypothetical protein
VLAVSAAFQKRPQQRLQILMPLVREIRQVLLAFSQLRLAFRPVLVLFSQLLVLLAFAPKRMAGRSAVSVLAWLSANFAISRS